jgi:hypothetical protein
VRAWLALGALALVAATPSAAAPAATITYVPEPVLATMSGRASVAVSPDGRHIYYLGGVDEGTGIAIVGRDPATGALSRAAGKEGCVVTWIAHTSCRSGPAFNNTRAMAVAPDGRDVAVGGHAVQQIALYRRAPGGGLAFRVCVGLSRGASCGAVRALAQTLDLAFSPDGRFLYAGTGRGTGSLLVLRRSGLRQLGGAAGCLQETGIRFPPSPPCGSVPARGFQPSFVRISPDGATVLVLSQSIVNPGFFVFSRDRGTGALTLLACATANPRPPCTAEPAVGPATTGLAFAPDGRTIVAVSANFDTRGNTVPGRIDLLHLDPATGALTAVACYEAGSRRCRPLAVPALAASVAVGRKVYVGGQWVQAYSLSTHGLTPVGAPARVPGFQQFQSLALSPDGRWLFGAGGGAAAFRLG